MVRRLIGGVAGLGATLRAGVRGGSHGRKVMSDVGWAYAASAASSLLLALAGLIVARALGPGTYGSLALLMAYSAIVAQLLGFRLSEAAVRYMTEFRHQGNAPAETAILQFTIGVELLLGVLGVLAVVALSFLPFIQTAHHDAMRLYSLTLLLDGVSAGAAVLLRSAQRFRTLSMISIAGTLTRTALLLGLVRLGIDAVVLAYVLSSAAQTALMWLAARRDVQRLAQPLWPPVRGALRDHGGGIRDYMLSGYANATLRSIPENLDVILLGFFVPLPQVGVYRLAKRLTGLFGQIVDPVSKVLFPTLCDLAGRRDARRFWKLNGVASAALATALFAIALPVTVFAGPLVRLAAGAAFAPAALLLQVMVWSSVLWGALVGANAVALSLGRPWLSSRIQLQAALIYAALLVPACWLWGPLGAATAFLAYFVAGALLWTPNLRGMFHSFHPGGVNPLQLQHLSR